jgi:hypothetical protein
MALLLTLIYGKGEKNGKSEIVVLILIVLMFCVDVHQQELKNRYEQKTHLTTFAIDTLVNSNKISFMWYKLDYKKADSLDTLASANSVYRKARLGAQWDWERAIYYWFPWVVVYVIFFYRKKEGMKTLRSLDAVVET